MTPRHFKDWRAFVNLAEQCSRFRLDSINGEEKKVYERIQPHSDLLHCTEYKLSLPTALHAIKSNLIEHSQKASQEAIVKELGDFFEASPQKR